MKSIWIFLLLSSSILCLLGAIYLLPNLQLDSTSTIAVKQPIGGHKVDTLALPKLSDAIFEQVISKRNVQPGDTLGFILKDRYKDLRDSLSAFAKTSKSQANFNLLPVEIQKDVKEILQQLSATQLQSKPERKSRFALRGVEREYLNSEIMGAEDASTELIGKLTHLEDSGRSNSAAATNTRLELNKKQAFISSAKKRLAKRVVNASPSTQISGTQSIAPRLTVVQRTRILALSNELPLDTQRVFAPIAGRYYRPDEGIGFIIATSHSEQKSMNLGRKESSGYILEAQGSPALWGKAQRKDQKADSESSAKNELRVSVN